MSRKRCETWGTQSERRKEVWDLKEKEGHASVNRMPFYSASDDSMANYCGNLNFTVTSV